MSQISAKRFIEELEQHKNEHNIEKMKRFFKGSDPDTVCWGLDMKTVFQKAKQFDRMPLNEIETLLNSPCYEVRIGAVSIMDYQARKKITEEERKALFDLYMNKHDKINNWDFVDRAAPSVVGTYLLDKPRDILYDMARSGNMWERRTSIVSTYAFIKKGEIDDTFRIAEILVNDEEELVQKAVGSWIREAGKKDEARLKDFLNRHASAMPRVTLRYAIEKFDRDTRQYYMSMGK